jgi:hypothetical protein
MAKYVHLIMVNAVEGRDDEFNAWLEGHHIPEVVEHGGFVKCHRFELAPEEAGNPKATKRYMHMYELETDDLAATKARIDSKRHLRTPLTPALDASDMFAVYYKAM